MNENFAERLIMQCSFSRLYLCTGQAYGMVVVCQSVCLSVVVHNGCSLANG